MKQPVSLIALDMDGTLFNGQSEISKEDQDAIREASSRRIHVSISTGRPYAGLPVTLLSGLGVSYAITSNGAAVWDLGTDPLGAVYSRYSDAETRQTSEPACLVRRLFPVEKAREVFGLYQEFEGSLSVFSDGRVIRDRLAQERMGNHLRRLLSLSTEAKQPNDGRFTVVRDLTEWMSRHAHEVEKMCVFFGDPDLASSWLPRFRAIPGVEVVQGSPENIEVTAAGVDKGEALLTLADRLGIPRAQTLAVGDSENDRAMLEKAGVAAVMANGMPQIKALADLVTTADCNHDGVAEVFETLGL